MKKLREFHSEFYFLKTRFVHGVVTKDSFAIGVRDFREWLMENGSWTFRLNVSKSGALYQSVGRMNAE